MRMLPVDQMRLAIRRFTGRKQQGVAVFAHEGIGREHRSQTPSPFSHRTLSHRHGHSVQECFVCAARSSLVVVNDVEERVVHRLPFPKRRVHPEMGRRIRQPASPRPFLLDRVGAEETVHPMSVTVCPSPLMCPVVGHWPRVASVFLMFVSHAFLFWRRPVVAVFCMLAGNTFLFCVFHAPMLVS